MVLDPSPPPLHSPLNGLWAILSPLSSEQNFDKFYLSAYLKGAKDADSFDTVHESKFLACLFAAQLTRNTPYADLRNVCLLQRVVGFSARSAFQIGKRGHSQQSVRFSIDYVKYTLGGLSRMCASCSTVAQVKAPQHLCSYRVASVSRIDKITGLFCKRAL